MNQSKLRDPRSWKKWQDSGAVETEWHRNTRWAKEMKKESKKRDAERAKPELLAMGWKLVSGTSDCYTAPIPKD